MRYLALAALTSIAQADYVWPGPHDHMEDLLYLQSGFNRLGFIDGILSCSFGQNEPGRQNTAEWIRTAYHDMSTADIQAGTGGLDASIIFESDRDQNKGSFINNTFGHLHSFHSARSSGADLLALAVVGSMSVCGGYEVPLRAGRIDATEGGRFGVPEPQQDIQTHTNIFAMQGFNQTEMIELVACGHTLGGVHHEDFPEITGDDTKGNVTAFEQDGSQYVFDNKVVTDYLANKSSNPLVAGHNDTMNSDKRIFGADGGATMRALANPTYFQERCALLMARMIDTVRSTVTLSEPLTPVEVKPYVNTLALNAEGSLDFSGYIRVRYGGDSGRSADDLSASITYIDRTGNNVSAPVQAARPNWQSGIGQGFNGISFVYFEWDTQVAADAGISAFNIHLTTPSTNQTVELDNGGKGFPVKDTVLFQATQSCQTFSSNGNGGYDGVLTIVAAVRDGAGTPELHFVSHELQPAVLERLETKTAEFVATPTKLAGYTLYEVKGMAINGESDNTSFDVIMDGNTEIDFQRTGVLTDTCAPLFQ